MQRYVVNLCILKLLQNNWNWCLQLLFRTCLELEWPSWAVLLTVWHYLLCQRRGAWNIQTCQKSNSAENTFWGKNWGEKYFFEKISCSKWCELPRICLGGPKTMVQTNRLQHLEWKLQPLSFLFPMLFIVAFFSPRQQLCNSLHFASRMFAIWWQLLERNSNFERYFQERTSSFTHLQ